LFFSGKGVLMSKSLYNAVMEAHLTEIESALPQFLPKREGALQDTLIASMEYACTAGGKRLRPVLTMEFCRLCGGDVKRALPFACAVEMIHSYSLVHDDLPCMDNSPLRRGRPSTHTEFGEAIALLAGDALLNRAFEVMLDPDNFTGMSYESVLRAAYSLAIAAGADGMVGGQALDLKSEGQEIDLDTLEKLQQGKTSALITAACEMGCYTAGASVEKLASAREFGTQLGLCFQIVDYILDATETSDQLGKPAGSDDDLEKATYVTLLGIDKARELAYIRSSQAVEALSIFGEEADGLNNLTKALLERNK
jgi:geranylgeranyl diphosphate synthase type II